jgi:hypothetical protein
MPRRCLNSHVHCSFKHNCQDVKSTYVSTKRYLVTHTSIMEYHSVLNNKEVLSSVSMWVNLGDGALTEGSHGKKGSCCMITRVIRTKRAGENREQSGVQRWGELRECCWKVQSFSQAGWIHSGCVYYNVVAIGNKISYTWKLIGSVGIKYVLTAKMASVWGDRNVITLISRLIMYTYLSIHHMIHHKLYNHTPYIIIYNYYLSDVFWLSLPGPQKTQGACHALLYSDENRS